MKFKKPEYFILDVDGVLSTGQFFYSNTGKVYKIFGPHDKDGLKMLESKLKISFITADNNGYKISEKRVNDMGYGIDLISEQDRYNYIKEKYDLNKVIFMGDGFHDAKILGKCMFGIAPANARIEARNAAEFITNSRAGEGAVLDACLEILKKYNL